MASIPQIIAAVEALSGEHVVVGVSGFGGSGKSIPAARVLIVDAVGLFHPELDGVFDLTIWVDVDLAEATARGKRRDRDLGRNHDALWDEAWVPTERAFVGRYGPRERAHLRFDN
jgi:hypothetical protein